MQNLHDILFFVHISVFAISNFNFFGGGGAVETPVPPITFFPFFFFNTNRLYTNVHAISSFLHPSKFRDERLSLGEWQNNSLPIILFQHFFTQIVCAYFVHKCAWYFIVCVQSLSPYLESRARDTFPPLFVKKTARWCESLNYLNKELMMGMITREGKLKIFPNSFPSQCSTICGIEKKNSKIH